LPDGRLDIGGTVYADPSEAAAAITGKPSNGWWLFLVDQKTRRSLRQVKREYLESVARDVEEDDGDDGDDDEL
jgi:Restriction Enzyme Adenine Methylase Associated